MTPSEVEIEADLAARAAEVAASRGETIEAVIERALRDYVAGNTRPSR
jgi:predicted transcriptional regulator